jgi:hypothetical protein
MNSRSAGVAVTGIVAAFLLLAALIVSIAVYTEADGRQQTQRMRACVAAGGSWVPAGGDSGYQCLR